MNINVLTDNDCCIDKQSQAEPLSSYLSKATKILGLWLQRHHQRRELSALNDAMLKDLGLTSADVDAEVSKPFWKA